MKNQYYCFRNIAKHAPFGWIRHESGAGITAFSTFRQAFTSRRVVKAGEERKSVLRKAKTNENMRTFFECDRLPDGLRGLAAM